MDFCQRLTGQAQNGERDSGVWLVRTFGRHQGPELGSLAREYARFP
ncbi:MAG: hypothetical protein QOD62_3132, partial [Actinomycetota bacterium]|nr:hypothetical protein [Actinomycetota bacterium]